MATHLAARSLLFRPSNKTIFSSLISRSFSSVPTPSALSRPTSLLRTLRPLSAAAQFASSGFISRCFSTRPTTTSLNDPSPNWSTRPPKETILLDGCDFEHWLIVMEKPAEGCTRDEIIDSYIKTLAQLVGSEEEARMKIYSVSTRHYFAFGALISEELSIKMKELPGVRWVLPDSYLDVRNKDYGGEPFIDGQAVPYDPKYHEEWVRNNARANERNRRNDRPRNFDRSRNYERRRENMPNQRGPPMSNQGMQNPPPNMSGMPPNNMGGPPPPSNYRNGPPPPPQNNYVGGPPPPQNNYGGGPPPPQNYVRGPPPPQSNYVGGAPPPPNNYMGGPSAPPPPGNYNNMGGMPQNNMGGMPPNPGWSNDDFQNGPHNGGMQQGGPSNYQNSYSTNSDGSVPSRNTY
ncbi:multiple organellar RNA editing factor 8, chloroplastic/mitochondrial-like [Euphorbia lathyris]|uniref:multiple organellar RNA editing factor 8, chloroplastic/mitochondrial-like n=1 Tax=Euphorbia lathyris TaxID=212925 RepID=UPI00331406CE